MAYSIRTKYYLQGTDLQQKSEYIKQIYIKNKYWNPPPAPTLIEEKITEFEKKLKRLQQNYKTKTKLRNLRNLTFSHLKTLQILKSDTSVIIKPTDKNLGPAIMEKDTYIKQVLSEHLLTQEYRRLTAIEAKNKIIDITEHLKKLINDNRHFLSKPELTFFQRSLQAHHRLPIFYGLPKVHKTPISLRPVVSNTNGLLAVFSTWLDFKMKDLLPLVKSYIRNSFEVINDLKHLTLPKEAKLFSADAKSMYTNIDTPTGLASIRALIIENIETLPENFPTELFLEVLKIVMENNIFCFADSHWLQLSGTAMGTPAACAYATISYGYHENSQILPQFTPNLLYFKRYIDDILGIWLPPSTNKESTWESFKSKLNEWGSLTWIVEDPSHNTTFLDLNMKIENSKILASTHQKPMNLYLYIPPPSAHPPSCLKGLIIGEMKRYWQQNNEQDFKSMLSKFIVRLTERGHNINTLTPILQDAATIIDKKPIITPQAANDNTLFIHWVYHPHGIQRQEIRRIYDETLKPFLSYDNMQVAISRPNNLRDLLSRASLHTPSDTTIQDFIAQHYNTT
jgi:hypothetical protein